jgi:hypothetical protein
LTTTRELLVGDTSFISSRSRLGVLVIYLPRAAGSRGA